MADSVPAPDSTVLADGADRASGVNPYPGGGRSPPYYVALGPLAAQRMGAINPYVGSRNIRGPATGPARP